MRNKLNRPSVAMLIMLGYHQIPISAANKCVISSILLAGYLTVFVSNIVQIRLCRHLAVYITVFPAHVYIYIYMVSTHMYTLYKLHIYIYTPLSQNI